MKASSKQNIKKIGIVLLVAGVVTAFFYLGLKDYLTLSFVKASQARFQEMYVQHPVSVIAVFVAVYIPVIALNLPGAVVLGLAAGALFGTLAGTVIISFASSIGATLACLLSRYLLRDWVQKKFKERLKKVNDGIREEGAFYLFSMRLIPVIPFFIINLVMGLTPMRLFTFYWVSQIGMLPGTAIFVNAGSQIAQIDSLAGIVSPGLVLSLALIGLFPLVTQKILKAWRRRFGCDAADGKAAAPQFPDRTGACSTSLLQSLEKMHENCTDCGACKKQCAFLQAYGTPKVILESHDFSRPDHQKLAFECSLCNLCGEVCPENLDPGHLFLKIRQEATEAGESDLSRYRTILGYEKKGYSPLFTYYALPEDCDTVFFPGCTLPGTRPETTWKLFEHLKASVPGLGVVLDCCTKPSHDLGRQSHFDLMFNEMIAYLSGNGIKRVLVACPNCHKIFRQYAAGIKVETVYEAIDGAGLPADAAFQGELAVHDSCAMRSESTTQDAVRSILIRMGATPGEMKHRRKRTLCCGEGGSVGFVRPLLAKTWGKIRGKEADGRTIVTYCAGCAGFLGRVAPTVHIADVIFASDKVLDGGLKVARAPFTYLNRLRLKQRFKGAVQPVVSRVRNCSPEKVEQQAAYECTLDDCTSRLCRKGAVLGAGFVLSVGLFFLVRHFMYLLDSYVYTAEFHLMFMQNNLEKANSKLFCEYFESLGPLGCLPNLLVAYIIEAASAPWKTPVLYAGLSKAFGTGLGSLISLTALMLTGLMFYGIGRFLFGEVLPLLRKTRAPLSGYMVPVLGALLAIPYLPVALPTVLGAVTRIRVKSMCLVLLSALALRVALLVILPLAGV